MSGEEVRPRGEDDLVLGVFGALLAAVGAGRGGRAGGLVAVGGILLSGVAFASRIGRAATRRAVARRSIDLHTSVVVPRPVRDAFAYLADFEHFPELMQSLESVTDQGGGISRWTVRLARGDLLTFDAMVTKWVPMQVIGWESLPNPHVRCSGVVRFAAIGPEETRLDVDLEFVPLDKTTLREALETWHHPSASRVAASALSRAGDRVASWDPEFEPAPPAPRLPQRD